MQCRVGDATSPQCAPLRHTSKCGLPKRENRLIDKRNSSRSTPTCTTRCGGDAYQKPWRPVLRWLGLGRCSASSKRDTTSLIFERYSFHLPLRIFLSCPTLWAGPVLCCLGSIPKRKNRSGAVLEPFWNRSGTVTIPCSLRSSKVPLRLARFLMQINQMVEYQRQLSALKTKPNS